MYKKILFIGILVILMMLSLPVITAEFLNDPEAKIIIKRTIFGDIWVEVRDIREEQPYPLPFNWSVKTSEIFMIVGFEEEGFFHWEDPRIETREGVIGNDGAKISTYNFWGISTFEIDVHAGNVEDHAIGFVLLGRAHLLWVHQ